MHKRLALMMVLFWGVSIGIATFATKAAFGETCVTDKCHATLLKAKNLHPVAESCENCHEATVTQHPQKDKKTFKLSQEPPDLCYTCHNPFGKKQNVHPPVAGGMCTSCHNPHGSDEAKMLVQPLQELCVTCHTDRTSQAYVHGPTATGDCNMCHNPHESDNKALVIRDDTELCTICHGDIQEELNKAVIHPAVLSGCPSCHNPHSSPYKKMLSAEGTALCFQCHPDIGEKMDNAKSVHPPIKSEKACASCHSPHANNFEKLLPKTGKDFCLDCHKGLIKPNQTVVHGPIKENKCTSCHDPHASVNIKLLVKEFPENIYPEYNDKEYELCFSCHNRDLLKYPDTSFATGFRDGERNLHYLHINRKKGRNCKFCHTLHAGELPKLITDKAAFGNWNIPLNYIKTESGGGCAPGCHKKIYYDRITPGKEPETLGTNENKTKKGGLFVPDKK